MYHEWLTDNVPFLPKFKEAIGVPMDQPFPPTLLTTFEIEDKEFKIYLSQTERDIEDNEVKMDIYERKPIKLHEHFPTFAEIKASIANDVTIKPNDMSTTNPQTFVTTNGHEQLTTNPPGVIDSALNNEETVTVVQELPIVQPSAAVAVEVPVSTDSAPDTLVVAHTEQVVTEYEKKQGSPEQIVKKDEKNPE